MKEQTMSHRLKSLQVAQEGRELIFFYRQGRSWSKFSDPTTTSLALTHGESTTADLSWTAFPTTLMHEPYTRTCSSL